MMNQSPFKLHSAYVPTGDQPEAIDSLVANLEAGVPEQILLGVTGCIAAYKACDRLDEVSCMSALLLGLIGHSSHQVYLAVENRCDHNNALAKLLL